MKIFTGDITKVSFGGTEFDLSPLPFKSPADLTPEEFMQFVKEAHPERFLQEEKIRLIKEMGIDLDDEVIVYASGEFLETVRKPIGEYLKERLK